MSESDQIKQVGSFSFSLQSIFMIMMMFIWPKMILASVIASHVTWTNQSGVLVTCWLRTLLNQDLDQESVSVVVS